MKSQLAIVFDYKGFEVSLFDGGRMLIKNVENERAALKVYRDIVERLGVGQ
jgi:hypothetical protein